MAFNGCILRPVRRLVRRIYAKPVRHRIFRLDTMWPWQKLIFCWPHLGTTLQVLWGRRIIPLGRPRCEACNRRDETCLVSKLADIWNFEQWLQLCTMVACSCSCSDTDRYTAVTSREHLKCQWTSPSAKLASQSISPHNLLSWSFNLIDLDTDTA